MFWGTHLISKCGDLGWRNPDLGHTLKFRGHIVSEIERQSRDDQHLGAYFGRVDMGDRRWKYCLRVSPAFPSAEPPPPLGSEQGRNIHIYSATENCEVPQSTSCPPRLPAGVILTPPGWLPMWKEMERYHPIGPQFPQISWSNCSPTSERENLKPPGVLGASLGPG